MVARELVAGTAVPGAGPQRADDQPGQYTTDQTLRELSAWSDNPSAVLALNRHTSTWRTPDAPGFVSYRERGHTRVQVLGPTAPDEAAARTVMAAFVTETRALGRRLVAAQLQAHDLPLFEGLGFRVNQMGASYALPTADYTLAGKKFVALRNKISRARRAGVTVEHTRYQDLSTGDRGRLADIDAEWLSTKGAHAKELQLLVGELGGPGAPARRLAVARSGEEILAYISLSAVWGARPGWLHDLSRKRPASPPGVMEVLVHESVERCVDEGARWWHFGLTPFTGLDCALRPSSASRAIDVLVRTIADRGARIYPAASQVAYKRKWGELAVTPEFLAFLGRPDPRSTWDLMRLAAVV